MSAEKQKFLKSGDCIVLVAVAAAAVLLLLCGKLLYPAAVNGAVEITVNGELYESFPLQENRTLTVKAPDGGYNTIIFENGAVRIADADCPDRLCVKQGSIQRHGQTVVCLPHGLVITVKNGETDDIDMVI